MDIRLLCLLIECYWKDNAVSRFYSQVNFGNYITDERGNDILFDEVLLYSTYYDHDISLECIKNNDEIIIEGKDISDVILNKLAECFKYLPTLTTLYVAKTNISLDSLQNIINNIDNLPNFSHFNISGISIF